MRSSFSVRSHMRIVFRIGINIGDVIKEGNDIYGDGVNLAARLEALAEPGGICLHRAVRNQVGDRLDLNFDDRGEIEVKNFDRPVRVFGVVLDEKAKALVSPVDVVPVRAERKKWPVHFAGLVLCLVGVAALVWWQPRASRVDVASVARMAFPLPDKPSIAVLPFVNLSDDKGKEQFADGLTNDIITDLSRFSNLFVIASNSTFTYKGKPVKVQQVAEDLGVRYVLEGSIQWSSDQIRVNAQLIDAITGRHLWADRYDRDASDLFAIQNEILKTIVATLALTVDATERERAFRKETENLGAYEYYLQAKAKFEQDTTKEVYEEARVLLEKAIRLDPSYAKAIALLAWVQLGLGVWQWSENPKVSMEPAYEMAHKECSRKTMVPHREGRRLAFQGPAKMGTILGRPAQGRSPYFADFARALGMDGTTFKDKVSRNNSFKAKMLELNMVEYIKHGWKYSSGWQLTSDIDYTQAQLYDERNSTAAIYGFGPA